MAIYDVLNTPQGSAALSFVANNAVNEIAVQVLTGAAIKFYNGTGYSRFQDGDNVKLKKLRMIMPYQYGRGNYDTLDYELTLNWRQATNFRVIAEFGNGSVNINSLCGDITPDVRLAAPVPGSGNFELELDKISFMVSQVYGPAALQGLTMYYGVQVEIEHTLQMVP